MELRKLEAFCKVVDLKSFTRAAEAMLLSQPTVSEHIRSLELELEQKLLDRFGRDVEPTPAGRILYGYGQKILQTRLQAIQAVEQYGGRMTGRVTLGCGTIPGTYILPAFIGRFRQLHPSIKTTLRITSSQIIAQKVLAGELELGVVGAKWNESGLSWTELFSDELTLVTHHAHPWSTKKAVSLKELVAEPFIMREQESGTRKAFAQILEANGFKESSLQEVAEIGSTAAIKEAVKAGLGVSILSKCAVMDAVQCGKLATMEIKGHALQRPFYLVQRKSRELSPVTSVFLDFLQQNKTV